LGEQLRPLEAAASATSGRKAPKGD